ncbi:MAG: cytochrome c oxidase assembly protein [Rhodospirillales bacterium]
MKRLRNYATLLALSLLLGVMVGITSYSVTLYRLFCQVTGANGTTQRVAAAVSAQLGRDVTVLFDTNVAPGLPWRFAPVQRSIKLRLGQDALVFFEAENLSNHDITGHAAFNVTPEKVGIYFKKIQCFCFTEEKLAAGAKVQMPVDFYVDPALALDPSTSDVHEITLSYTFFESKKPQGAPDLARFAAGPPDAAAGARLFAENCGACHALDRAKIGPPLAGVVGRRAGSVPLYPYSMALKFAGFNWDEARLDRWLADPQAELPGAQMPMKTPVAQARRDIIAYLKTTRAGS